jgi:uncharacterized membrane protein
MMLLWIPFLILAVVAFSWMTRSGVGMGCMGAGHAGPAETPDAGGNDPLEIARRRLARGEITTSEFEEIRRAIS